MEGQKNKTNGVNGILIVIIVILLGVIAFCAYKIGTMGRCVVDDSNLQKGGDTSVPVEEVTNDTKEVTTTNTTNEKLTFEVFADTLNKNNKSEVINAYNEYSSVTSFYLNKGNIYVSIYDKKLSNDDKIKINNLTKEKVNFVKDTFGNPMELYKLSLDNIILMDDAQKGQDGTKIIFFENNKGEVYYFNTSQTGAEAYPLFNAEGQINIKKSNKLKNIVKFVNNVNDGWFIYGIDINGNTIDFNE